MKITSVAVTVLFFVCLIDLGCCREALSDNSANQPNSLPSWVKSGKPADFSAMQKYIQDSQAQRDQMFGKSSNSSYIQGGAQPSQTMMHHQARSAPAARVQTYSSGDASGNVRQVFEQYKMYDLSNSMQIMTLYAPDAQIDVMGTKYNKASYTRYVSAAYNNPASGANTHTRYGEPNIRVSDNSAQVSFAGSLGPASMNVYWTLRRNASGWQIASERFTAR